MRALARLRRDRESLVDKRQGGVGTPLRSLKLGEHSVEHWRPGLVALIEIARQRPTQLLSPNLHVMKSTARPTAKDFAERDKEVHSVPPTKRMRHLRRAKHGGRFVAFGIELRAKRIHARAGRGVTQFRRALDRLFGQLAGAPCFAEAPHRQREMGGCHDPRI